MIAIARRLLAAAEGAAAAYLPAAEASARAAEAQSRHRIPASEQASASAVAEILPVTKAFLLQIAAAA